VCVRELERKAYARFTYCPSNKTVVINREGVAVWWRNPIVDVIVSSPPVLVSRDTLPGGEFSTGVTQVLYKTDNADGVAAYCLFFVIVKKLGEFRYNFDK